MAVLAQLGDGAQQARPGRSPLAQRRRIRHGPEQRDGEQRPPQRHRNERPFHRLAGVRQAEQAGLQGHRHVRRQQHAAAQIAGAITQRRHAIRLCRCGHAHQQRIVKGQSAKKADGRYAEQAAGEQPLPLPGQRQQRGGQHADHGEDQQIALVLATLVGRRAE